MNFIGYTERRRHARVDRYIEAAVDFVRNPVVTAAIGENVTEDFVDFAETYFVPNVRHGEVSLAPSQQESDGCAILAERAGTTLALDMDLAGFTPGQSQTAFEFLVQQGYTSEDAQYRVDHYLDDRKDHPKTLTVGDANEHARVVSIATELTDDLPGEQGAEIDLLVHGRPYMAINTSIVRPKKSDGILLHEFVHRQTCSTRPIELLGKEKHSAYWTTFADETDALAIAGAALRAVRRAGGKLSLESSAQVVASRVAAGILRDRNQINANPFDEMRTRMKVFGYGN